MICPQDSKIAFFGGANNKAVVRAVKHLAEADFEVVIADHDPREAAYLSSLDLRVVQSRSLALEGAQIVLTSCETPEDVEDLYFGENGLLELMEPGQYAIDLSFSTPQLAREIYAMATVNDIVVLDAPIINIISDEQTALFVGGDPDSIKLLSPLFPYLASSIYPQEKPGEGQMAAVLSIVAFAGSLMSMVEALALQRISGLSNRTALGILSLTCGDSPALHNYAPRIENHDYSGVIDVSTFINYLDVVLDAAEDLELTLPMVETLRQLYGLVGLVGGDELNIQALSLLYEDEATCAKYGLDWTLAQDVDELREHNHDHDFLDLGLEELLDESLGDENPNEGPSLSGFSGFFSQN